MSVSKVIIISLVILNVYAEDIITSSENEMDLIIDMLLKNEIKENTDSIENAIEEQSVAAPVYSNGAWKCGKCEDVDKLKRIYTETYTVDANDYEADSIDLQVGLYMQKISCVIVTSGVLSELSSVQRLRGNCAGEGATLRLVGAGQWDIEVYG